MKKLIYFVPLIFLLNGTMQAQFVTLQGRQFKDKNGNDFYPMVMNYPVFVRGNSSVFYGSPDPDNGTQEDFECNDSAECNTQYLAELTKIKEMGFNSVRVGFGPYYMNRETEGNRMFSVRYRPTIWPLYYSDLPSGYNDSKSQSFFNVIINFLNQADSVGLKVILIAAEDGLVDEENTPKVKMQPAYDDQASNDYSNYLSKLASVLKDHPALLAYDLWNEPIYSDMWHYFPNGVNFPVEMLKQVSCGYVSQWYDAIRQYDTHHLITLGGASIDEMFYWDMGILKLDFYSVHRYPVPDKINNFDVSEGIENFNIIMHWMGQACPKPWIIGETGFSADDNTSPSPLDADSAHHIWPYMNGSEDQQTQFAEQSLESSRNSLASGYSWWKYQNSSWGSIGDNSMAENFFGLLHFGTGINNEKLATTVFRNYLDSVTQQPPALGANTVPSGYYDPYNTGTLNSSHTNAVSGIVQDDKGNPINNAVVYANNWLWTFDPTPQDTVIDDKVYNYSSLFTFTDSSGYFEIIPYNYYQQDSANPHRITILHISAVGAERKWLGGWNSQQMNTNVGTVTLKKRTMGFDADVSNETVNSGETRNYYGWNSLTASNITINGISNFTSKGEIHITGEFHASAGSEVHIYNGDGFSECSNFESANYERIINPFTSPPDKTIDVVSKEIDLQFLKQKVSMSVDVFPNPNNGTFTINIQNPAPELTKISVFNLTGELIKEQETLNNEVIENFNFLPKGIYIIRVKNQSQSVTKKLIIN